MLILINQHIKTLKFFRIPTNTHSPSFSPLPSLGYCISGKEVEVCDSGSGYHQLCRRHGVPTLPKLHGPLSLLHQRGMVLSQVWLLRLGLNSSASLPLQPHFRLLLQSVIPASIPEFFQLYWAAIVSLGMAWSQSFRSSHTGSHCNQGELLPSYILGGSHSRLPGSKHGHSYLTYL